MKVLFAADPEWAGPLSAARTDYRTVWRAKADEINAAIAANAEQEELREHDCLPFTGSKHVNFTQLDAIAPEALQAYKDEPGAEVRPHLAQIRPDVGMKNLLNKTQKVEHVFAVLGQPRTRIEPKSKEFVVRLVGVDLYDPVANALQATGAGKVAAWFFGTHHDGKVFCICQAFFPDRSSWDKLARALTTSMAEGAFEALSDTTSLPFKPHPRHCVAVKDIDPRGNEVMRAHRLDGGYATKED